MDWAAFPKKNQLANQFSIRNLQPTCPIIQYSVFSHTFVVLKAKKTIAKYRLATFHRNSNSWHIIFHSESAACPQLLRIRFSAITFFVLAPGFSAKKYFSPRVSSGYHLISVLKSSNIIQTQIHTHTHTHIRVQVCKRASGKPMIRKFSIATKTIVTLSSKM